MFALQTFFILPYRNTFGTHHNVYADALLDKGFFLLNVDSINQSVEVYMVMKINNISISLFIYPFKLDVFAES